jgi:hypothetical protein
MFKCHQCNELIGDKAIIREAGQDVCPKCDSISVDYIGSGLNNNYFFVFIEAFNCIAKEVHKTAIKNGFWNDTNRNEGEIIALIHSEVSEVTEALRDGDPPDKHLPIFSSAEVEYADVIIRIMDNAAARGYRVGEALIMKLQYNQTRGHMHGGKKF